MHGYVPPPRRHYEGGATLLIVGSCIAIGFVALLIQVDFKRIIFPGHESPRAVLPSVPKLRPPGYKNVPWSRRK